MLEGEEVTRFLPGAYILSAIFLKLIVAISVLAGFPSVGHAQGFTLPPAEKVPTFLGLDLPLLPGERLLPLGNSGCSMVVFAPKPEHYEAYRNLWGNGDWSGACRFGLIHGSGKLSDSRKWSTDASAIYGTRLYSQAVYSGDVFSSINSKRMFLSLSEYAGNLEKFKISSGNIYVVRLDAFDKVGNARSLIVQSEDLSQVCANNYSDEYKPFATKVKRVCSRSREGQFVVTRREGSSILGYPNQIVWLEGCPLKRGAREADCRELMRKAIGERYDEIEAVMLGGPAARSNMIQEVLKRYAPLEATVEVRLKDRGATGGVQR